MNSYSNGTSDKLIVFSRYPVPGKTKTRLIPSLGPVGAAELQRELTERTFYTINRFREGRQTAVEVCFTGGSAEQMTGWLGCRDYTYSRQAQGDLGRRMYSAFQKSFQRGISRAVLVGTDIPGLTGEHLENAFYALDKKDLVLGPSNDGGYWLIGIKQPLDLFQGISWGKEDVLDQTLRQAEKQGHHAALLSPLNDIDTIDDLIEWNPDFDWKAPYVSVVIPTLNEADRIGTLLRRLVNTDAEVIVVDGESTDETVNIAEKLGVKVIKSRRGRAIQQNTGASVSRGKVLFFLHADTLVPENYPSVIFGTLMGSKPVVGAFRFKTDMDTPVMKIIELAVNMRSRYFNLPYGDQGIFMTKRLFEKAGGFPDVPIAEDFFFIGNIRKTARIKIAQAEALTSARRWRRLGILRNTLINLLILMGCILHVRPEKLYNFYHNAERGGPNDVERECVTK